MFSFAGRSLRNTSSAVAAIAAIVAATPAFAGSATGTLDVELNVTNACVVNGATAVSSSFGSAGKMLFADQPGLFDNVDAQALTTGGNTIGVTCSPGAVPSLTVGSGAHDSSGTRRLVSGANSVAYHLFSDAARTNELAIGQAINLGTATSSQINVPIFGGVNSGGVILAAGKYTDTVQLTLSW
jgi:spore coat protein U-like protein